MLQHMPGLKRLHFSMRRAGTERARFQIHHAPLTFDCCWRSPKTDHLCALKIDQGWSREIGLPARPV